MAAQSQWHFWEHPCLFTYDTDLLVHWALFGGYNDSLHNLSLVLFPPPQLSEHWDQEVQSAQTANLQFGGHIPVLGLQPIHGQLQVVLAIMKNNVCVKNLV